MANDIIDARNESISRLKSVTGEDPEIIFADGRYGFISSLLKEVLEKPQIDRRTLSDRIDSIVVNRWLGIPIFLGAMWLVFWFTFTAAAPFMDFIDGSFGWMIEQALGIEGWFGSFLGDGIIGGVGSVLIFVPNIFLMFIALSILEDSGYLARAAFVMDRLMHRIGLHGRSFIPLLLGFGCNVPAIMATRTIENPNDRLTTILVNPFMSCGARLPIYVLLGAAFFPNNAGTVIFVMYTLGIALAIASAFFIRRFIAKGPSGHFVMELPPYRVPTVKGVLIHMWERGWLFLKRAGTIIFAVVVLIWFLGSMPWGVEYGTEDSWLGDIGKTFAPVFAPAGFGQWQSSVGLVFGFLAKEVVVGAMGTLFGAEEDALGDTIASELGWTPLVAFGFMAFTLIYVPCVATVAVIKRETQSWKWMGFSIVYTTVLAYVAAVLIYQVGTAIGF
jgi:ferrous iron transport protein B